MIMKRIILLPLLLLAMMVNGEPVVRIVSTNGSGSSFATEKVHKLILSSTAVDVVNIEGSVLLSVPLAEIARVEFTEGKPDTPTAMEAIITKDTEPIKIIEHGQVYIIRSGRKYTIMGVEVESKE